MNYFELSERKEYLPLVDRAWMERERSRLKCPECNDMQRLDPLPDIPLEDPPIGPMDTLFGLGLATASVQLLEELGWGDMQRYLVLGRMLGRNGRPLTRYLTFQGRHRTFSRGTPETTYRGLCSTCGTPLFHASGLTEDRYLLSTRLPPVPVSESSTWGLVVTQEYVDRLSPAMRKKLYVDPLPVIDEPRDGLGELPF